MQLNPFSLFAIGFYASFVLAKLYSIHKTPIWFLPESDWILCLALFFLFYEIVPRRLRFSLPWGDRFFSNFGILFLGLAFVFPFQNGNWGDGVLLLENHLLETKLFGFQLTMDELLSALFASGGNHLARMLGFSDSPVWGFRMVSYLSGIVFWFGIVWFSKKQILSQLDSHKFGGREKASFFLSGGIFLFSGYVENYSLATVSLFLGLFWILQAVDEGKKGQRLLLPTTLFVSVAILFHLVSGYMVVLLLYLWYSYKESSLRDALIPAVLGSLVVFLPIAYFLYLSDPTIDLRSTHLAHPPLYPPKRWVSANHFKEIFSVLIWNTGFPLLVLAMGRIFYLEAWTNFKADPKFRLLAVSCIGFGLHGFFHNPQLGFPADWDLMGFYWIPISILAFLFLRENPLIWDSLGSIPLFFAILTLARLLSLHEPTPSAVMRLKASQEIIQGYMQNDQDFVSQLPKESKKFFTKLDFFYKQTDELLARKSPSETNTALRTEVQALRKEWREGFAEGRWNSNEELDRLIRTTTEVNTRAQELLGRE